MTEEAQKYVWEGAIPLQISLHQSEVTTHPPPSPALVLAPRVGYLPLLLPLIKPQFAASLPPGIDTLWFEYKGLPLKWYIPTGVLFDMLCAEPERPWNLTVHFRGYPSNILIPYEGEDSVKWNFINSLKEADYIINGNCKNIMNMSQTDQTELWQSIINANLEAYQRASSKLKICHIEDEFSSKSNSSAVKSPKSNTESDLLGQNKTEKIPIRLYIRYVEMDIDEFEASEVDSWDQISCINRPFDFCRAAGKYCSLRDALKAILPELFPAKPLISDSEAAGEAGSNCENGEEEGSNWKIEEEAKISSASRPFSDDAEIKIVRIQGIEPKLELPISWLINSLRNPEHFLHVCLYVKSAIQL